MSESNAQEPTMEEILASIRRIISEDDAPAAAPAAGAEAAPEAAAEPPEPEGDFGDDDDVLELTEPVPSESAPEPEVAPEFASEPAPEPVRAAESAPSRGGYDPETSLGDLDVFTPPPSRPAPAASTWADEDDAGLISSPTAEVAASAFSQLSRTLAMPPEARTLEDVVRELLRPMLKEWLDQNLSSIVETAVQAEVERISRLRRF